MSTSTTPTMARPAPLANDLIAGLVVFLVAIPLCLGIALASGAPIISGVISGIIGGIVVGAISGSHISVSGPAAGLAAIVMAQIQGLGSFEAFLFAVMIAGGIQIVAGLLRGGVLANYFPNNVIKGLLVAIGVAISEALRLTGSAWSIEQSHLVTVPVIGSGGIGWGDLLTFPDFSRWSDPAVLRAAVTLAVVASLETLLNLEATDKLDPERRVSPPNRELVAQGAGNMLAGLVGGLPMTSVIVRSSVNAENGARTRRAAIFHGVLLLGCLLMIPGVLNRIPLAALAAVLIATGLKLASPKVFKQMWREGLKQFVPFFVTVVAIVVTDLLVGVMIGLATSIAFILWSNVRRGFRIIKEDHVGGLVHRIELATQASFLNRAQLATTLGEFRRGDQVAIDARTTDYIDPDIVSMIKEFAEEAAPARGVSVSLVGFKDRYPLQDVKLYVDWTTKDIQDSLTPNRVLRVLKEGNDRFASGQRLNRDLAKQVDATAAGQHPMAVVLSCIDSRSPAEILFDLGLGDIFSVRLAGNVASPKALGSMEFACKVAGAKLIVVLGHTSCGAVKATCDFVSKGLDPVEATGLTNLGSITEPISEAVAMETRTTGVRDSSNHDFVDRVATIHVRNTIRWIEEHSPVLRSMIMNGEIGIAGAMYDVSSGKVEFMGGVGAAGVQDAVGNTGASA